MLFRLPIFYTVVIVVSANADNAAATETSKSSQPVSRRVAMSIISVPDLLLSEENVNSEAASGPENTAVEEWEDDFDLFADSSPNANGSRSMSQAHKTTDGIKESPSLNQEVLVKEGEATEPTAGGKEGRGNISLDEKRENSSVLAGVGDDGSSSTIAGYGLARETTRRMAEWPDDDDEVQGNSGDSPSTFRGNGLQAGGVTPTGEWPDDDDEVEANVAVDTSNKGEHVASKENAVREGTNGEKDGGQESLKEKQGDASEWPDDDDDDSSGSSAVASDGPAEETISPPIERLDEDEVPGDTAVGVSSGGSSSTLGGNGLQKDGIALADWPDDDDEVEGNKAVGKSKIEGEPPVDEWPEDDDEVEGDVAVGEYKIQGENDGSPSAIEGDGSAKEGTKPIAKRSEDTQVAADMAVAVSESENEMFLDGGDNMQEGQDTAMNDLHNTKTVAHGNEDNIILSRSNQSIVEEGESVGIGYEEAAVETVNTVVNPAERGTENGGDVYQHQNKNNDVGAEQEGIGQVDSHLETHGDGAGSGANADNNVAGNENYSTMDGGSFTQSNIPGNNHNGLPSYEDDEDSIIANTFNVLMMAVVFTFLLVLRKRVLDRVHVNSSLGMASAIKDELVDLMTRLFNWATNRMREGGTSGDGRNTSSSSADNETATSAYSRPFGVETIPLSTATDEEWGWEDEDMMGGPNLELSGIAEKENDDLAMAIAMSLSETETHVGEEAKSEVPSVVPNNRNIVDKSSGTFSSTKDKAIIQQSTAKSKQESVSETPPKPPPSSIEDLLGQMGGTGGHVITSFGKKPMPKQASVTEKKGSSGNDIFATMGLSIQSTTKQKPAPKKNEISPSLIADAWDDDIDADSWGDDGDLDDLLDS